MAMAVKEIGEASDNPFQYTGRENDGDTGLYYYRARYYSPEMGRFISEDPIGLAGGINMYSYVGNRPVNFRDPLGLQWYVNIGGNFGYIIGIPAGILLAEDGIYPYIGYGLMSTPGFNVTWSHSDPTLGWNVGLEGGFYGGGQFGFSERLSTLFWEIGLVTPGASFTRYYVWDDPSKKYHNRETSNVEMGICH